MPLREYHKKRNFKKSPEPQPSSRLFVVQEHHASHLHYDLRLEIDGVLKSWAVPKRPSMKPHVKRLAIAVEDHPLSYGNFEGVIPEGEYGAGEVYIWDKGTWEPSGSPKAGLRKGHLEFTLKGRKLKGKWILIKTQRSSGKKAQWLLIKRTDEHTPTKEDEEPEVYPFVEPQLATSTRGPPTGAGWLHETKFDGYRTQAHLRRREVTLYSRSGLDWTQKYPSIENALRQMNVQSAVLDGEVVWLDEKGRSDFQELQQALKKGHQGRLYYYAFDLLFLNGEDCRSQALRERKKKLRNLIESLDNPHVRYSDHIVGHGKELFKKVCQHNLEGLVSKDAHSKYHSGRGTDWVKSKCKLRQEFVIGGYSQSKEFGAGFGALLVGVYELGKLRYVGKVGTGFSKQSAHEIFKKIGKLKQKKSPFQLQSPHERGLHWVKPVWVAEVTFANWTKDHLLRSAVFMGLREDKPAFEVQDELRKKKKDIKISNPQKIVYKKEKLTKGDVASYYSKVSPRILPHLMSHPLVIVRYTDAVGEKYFYQKHSHPEISETRSWPFITVSSLTDLLQLIQMRTLEFHCWGSDRHHLDNPNQIVMDLDPGPKVPWRQVVEAAFEIREIFKDLRLDSFVKVSGGKGVHIHVPLAPIYTWIQIESFAKAVGREMARRHPESYTISMAKSRRVGKIFIDYFRNKKGATSIAPYSLRARKVSSVAMPILWSELRRLPGADAFTLKKSLEYIKKTRDPWSGFFDKKQRIPILKPQVADSQNVSHSKI